jgi:hypothetical protein
MSSSYTTNIDHGKEVDIPITIEYTASKPSGGRSEYRGGPPMEPDEDGGVEIDSIIRDDNKEDIIEQVSQEIIIRLENEIMESLADDYGD